jgi:hypothetical protein
VNKILPVILALISTTVSEAQFVDTNWKVVGYVGEAWFANPSKIIGKHQYFFKGEAYGVFYVCDFGGQSKTYTKYTPEEFLANKEFVLFNKDDIELGDGQLYVHRISCNGPEEVARRVLYPFVTQDDSNKAYYLFEGAIYILEY